MFWRDAPSSNTLIPNFLDGVDTESRKRKWKAFGALFALHFLRQACPPPRVSPWVILTLLSPSFTPPFSLVRNFEPDLAETLAVWFERPQGSITSLHLGTSPDGRLTPIDYLICDVYGSQTVCSFVSR
jgi:hypothetical protein